MPVYSVIDKATQVEITRYAAATIHETLNGVNYPQAAYDHIEYVEPAVDAPPPVPVILTKREFIKRFTVAEYATIKTAAAANPTLDYYWQMFMLAENIDTTDPDTIAGVTMLEQAGLIAAGRAQEILATQTPILVIPDFEPFVQTHTVDGVACMVSPDGKVRFEDGKWTTLDTLAAQGKGVV